VSALQPATGFVVATNIEGKPAPPWEPQCQQSALLQKLPPLLPNTKLALLLILPPCSLRNIKFYNKNSIFFTYLERHACSLPRFYLSKTFFKAKRIKAILKRTLFALESYYYHDFKP
jgi:hypothetical protein